MKQLLQKEPSCILDTILKPYQTRNKKTNPCNSIQHEQQQETLQQTETKHNTLFLSRRIISRNTPHIVERTFLFPSTTSSPHLIQLHHLSAIHTLEFILERQEYTRDIRKRRKENKILDSHRIGFHP